MKNPASSGPFNRLVPLSWTGELTLICAGMLASFLIAGFWYPYWRIADMDFMELYNALLLNDHLPQELFDHPGYLSFLLLSYWLHALHGLGLIAADSLSTLPPASDVEAFSHAWMQATQAGRVLSLIFAVAFVLAFSFLLRALIRDWRIAAFGGFLLAFSGGMAMQMRALRTEMPAAGLFMIALLLMMIAAWRGERGHRPLAVGIAALLIALGIQFKIQILFLICALPVLLLPFGSKEQRSDGFWRRPQSAWPALAAFAACAALAAYMARHIVGDGLFGPIPADLGLPVLRIGAATYWSAVVVWLAVGMAVYGYVWRVGAPETLAAMFAAVAGCMIGLLALYIRYHPDNAIVIFHPMERMFGEAAAGSPELASQGALSSTNLVLFLLYAIGKVIANMTFVLSTSPRPAVFLEWLVIVGAVMAIRRREWLFLAGIAAIMATVWAVDTLDVGRGLKQQYFILTDPLIIIAAALVIAKLTDLQNNRWTYPLGLALVVAHVVLSQSEPIKNLFRTPGPDSVCELRVFSPRLSSFPYCPPRGA